MNGWPNKRKEFIVNHFVPIFQQHHPTLPLNDHFKTEIDGEWHEVKSRKLQLDTKKVEVQWWKTGQSSTKLFQGNVGERKVQVEDIKREKKKDNRVQSNTESLELRGNKKQRGHGNVTAAENEKKKNAGNIKPETDQDTTDTLTTRFGKQTVNKGYELKPKNSGTSKQIKTKRSERKQSSSPPEKIQKAQHVQRPENDKNRPSKQEKYKVRNQEERENEATVKRDKKSPWKEKRNEAVHEHKAPNKMRSMKLKNKSNSARRKIIKRILTSQSNCKKQKMIVTIAK